MKENSPYSPDDINSAISGGESYRVEFKENFTKDDVRDKARQAVCAFANDLAGHNAPGVLVIGLKDDGTPAGIAVDDKLLCSLSDISTDGNILPLPVINVRKHVVGDAEVAVVTVLPSHMPPVRYKGHIWVRTGPCNKRANAQEERILNEKRRYKDIPFDIYPVLSARISDLMRVIFEVEYIPAAFAPDVIEENGRSYEEQLSSCKMIVSPEDSTPTVLGLLALGKSPQDFISGAYIQFLRIDGRELTDPVSDSEEIRGTLSDILRRAEEKLKSHNRVAVDMTSAATHTIDTLYPMPALQQILYNAVLHRTYEGTNTPVRINWYSDRIEIHSPGGPYGQVNASNFGYPGVTDYRNPNIASVLKTMGFVQVFGRGIAVARKVMMEHGNPEPKFEVDSNAVVCTLEAKR